MTPQQALEILAQVSSEFKGTKKDHEVILQALQVLKNFIEIDTKVEYPA